VVEHLDLEQVSGTDEIAGDADVGFGRGGIAAGMVVGEDDGMGTGGDGGTKDFAGVDEDLVEEAFGDGIDPKEAATGVEEQDLETFDGGGDGVVAKEGGDSFGMIEDGGFPTEFLGESAGEGEGGLEGDGLVAADAAAAELLPGRPGDGLEVGEPLEKFLGDGDGGGTGDTGAEEDGDEFGGAEGVGATFGEAFTGAICLPKVLNPCVGQHGLRRGVGEMDGRVKGRVGWKLCPRIGGLPNEVAWRVLPWIAGMHMPVFIQ